jgi:hypothetical protein
MPSKGVAVTSVGDPAPEIESMLLTAQDPSQRHSPLANYYIDAVVKQTYNCNAAIVLCGSVLTCIKC